MSAPYSAPKSLERSRNDRFIGGVCGGIAKYLNMDPTLVRILTVIITLFTFVPVIAYLIAMFVMPEEQPSDGYPRVSPPRENEDVWGTAGAPWDQQASRPAENSTPR